MAQPEIPMNLVPPSDRVRPSTPTAPPPELLGPSKPVPTHPQSGSPMQTTPWYIPQDTSPGYPPQTSPGYPPQQPSPGYPPQQPSPGYPPQQPSPGYPHPQPTPGYPPPQTSPGYPPPQTSPGYPPSQPTPGYPPPQQMQMYPPPQQPPAFGGAAPVTNQPVQTAGVNWMPLPQSVRNCPPGLEYLITIDQLLVQQTMEIFEMLTGFETENKYKVKNNAGQIVYFAVEESEGFTRQCFGSIRPFDMKIIDNFGNEVIHFYRPFRCDSCCYPGFLQVLEVTAPVGDVIGYISQKWNLCEPRFIIENANHEAILLIHGPCCTLSCGSDVEFKVMSTDGVTEVGMIRKQWSGLMREAFTDVDNFGITFPMDLDVHMKAVMLAACFLIDFMYYETRAERRGQRRHHFH